MRLLFWVSLALLVFAYAGYPILLYIRARLWPRPVRPRSICPGVSIILPLWNEGKYLPAKLANIAVLDYPADRLEVIAVSDGSTDATNTILAAWEGCNRRALFLPEHSGKASAINQAVAAASGEIIIFTDARQAIERDGVRNLVANFADPSVGCVSGELMMKQRSNAASAQGVGMYWRLEKKIRYWEGLAGSTVGATGAFYGVRKALLSPLPKETILDDLYIPLQSVRQGQRVIFEPGAVAWDDLTPSPRQEFRRKVRTLVGNYQLVQLAPWILTRCNPIRIQFVCHKLLRLVVPFGLVILLISSMWLRKGIYEDFLGLQLFFYTLAILTTFRKRLGVVSRLSELSLAFIVLNAAATMAFIYFVTGKKAVWVR